YLPSFVTRPSRVVFTWLIGVPPKFWTGALNAFRVVTTAGVVATRSSTLRLDNGRSGDTPSGRNVPTAAGCVANHRVAADRHFNILRSRCNLQREVQPDLLTLAQHHVVISRGLKTGECCRQRICAGLKAGKHKVPALIRKPRVGNAGIDVFSRNFDARYQRAR